MVGAVQSFRAFDRAFAEMAVSTRATRDQLEANYCRSTGTYKLLLEENPSLRPGLDSVISKAYREAAGNIAIIIGRSRKGFPETCPYTTDQLLDDDFLP